MRYVARCTGPRKVLREHGAKPNFFENARIAMQQRAKRTKWVKITSNPSILMPSHTRTYLCRFEEVNHLKTWIPKRGYTVAGQTEFSQVDINFKGWNAARLLGKTLFKVRETFWEALNFNKVTVLMEVAGNYLKKPPAWYTSKFKLFFIIPFFTVKPKTNILTNICKSLLLRRTESFFRGQVYDKRSCWMASSYSKPGPDQMQTNSPPETGETKESKSDFYTKPKHEWSHQTWHLENPLSADELINAEPELQSKDQTTI